MAAEIDERTQYDWFSVGRIHETQGEDDLAIKAYEESIKIDPEYAKAWFFLAKLYYRLGKKDKAKECVDRMLKLEPDWTKYVDKYMPKLK